MRRRMLFLQGLPRGSKIYVAGPMSIYKENCYNFERFFYWSAILRASGYEPINPAEMDCRRMLAGEVYEDTKAGYEDILAKDLKAITDEADAIFNLLEWDKSPGALRENKKASEKGIPVYFESDFK